MRRPDDLREVLAQLADRATDRPDMLVTRPGRPNRVRRVAPLLLVACLLAVLLAVPLLSVTRSAPPSPRPAGPATAAVPAPSTPAPTVQSPTPNVPAPSATTTAARADPSTALEMRPMTDREIDTRTARCTAGRADVQSPPRRGRLVVRYAMVQAAAGVPADSVPRTVLLLEDDLGRLDCSDPPPPTVPGDVDSGFFQGWYGKGGDDFPSDDTAGGHELATISGGTSGSCGAKQPRGSDPTELVSAQLVLAVSREARTARVTVTARGGTRTVTVATRGGYAFVPVQVSGTAARHPWRARIELLDAAGKRLRIQRYAGSISRQLEYTLPPCR